MADKAEWVKAAEARAEMRKPDFYDTVFIVAPFVAAVVLYAAAWLGVLLAWLLK